MAEIAWTVDQQRAIRETGRSIVVSAAAGSGKTAVLAERCVYLVCDAPPPHRCPVDRLLVVTFTEAAAAEMKGRIRENLHARLERDPSNDYLRQQVALLETAHISTLNAFCLWIVRRWFQRVGIDPAAAVLAADEASGLKSAVLEEFVSGLYDGEGDDAKRFRALIDTYGLGNDGTVLRFVGRLAGYLDSIPDAEGWLTQAREQVDGGDDRLGTYLLTPLREALRTACEGVRRFDVAPEYQSRRVMFYADILSRHVDALGEWLETADGISVGSTDGIDDLLLRIAKHTLSSKGVPRVAKDAPPEESDMVDAMKSAMKRAQQEFKTRLQEPFGLFTTEEIIDGLDSIAPFVGILADLVSEYRRAYAAAKRQRDVLDFADQERFAFELTQDAEVIEALRKRFAHVLVDEFQDINPLQNAVLSAVGRNGAAGNLFTVGDIKQSIYRFRAAEPNVFRDRLTSCSGDSDDVLAIHLQENFRSCGEVIEGVNLLFSHLMSKPVGGIAYGEADALRHGRREDADAPRKTIDVHLLERDAKRSATFPSDDDDDEEEATVDPNDPSEWETIEREAYVIATQIKKFVGEGESLRFGDVAILLRSPAYRADVMAQFLNRMGIPTYSHARGSLLGSTEIRDVRALLDVLDNMRQDIPLAAVLRSPILGQSLSEDDLLAIRRYDRSVPFHAAAPRYADDGSDGDLRDKLKTIMGRLARYRRDMRERPFHEALWSILQETGYTAYVVGLPGGAQRLKNLWRFHERAGKFASFRHQDLRGFVRFVAELEEDGRDMGSPAVADPAADAVQIMSIHSSKGLEFPLVFVADLARAFNLRDRNDMMIFERDGGIGLDVVDPEQMIKYPSAAKRVVAARIERETRAEELRLLYVALTRAREKLVLVGTTKLERLATERKAWSSGDASLSSVVASAGSPLDWLTPVLSVLPRDQVEWPRRDGGEALFQIAEYPLAAMGDWQIDPLGPKKATPSQAAAAGLDALPANEPLSDDRNAAEVVIERVKFHYPHLALSSVRSVVSASETHRVYDAQVDPEARMARSEDDLSRSQSQRRGTATHAVMQFMNLDGSGPIDVEAEIARLVSADRLSRDDADLVDCEGVAWFLDSDLGRAVRRAGDAYRREFMFVAAQPALWFDETLAVDPAERVLVRGVVDGVFPRDDGIEIVDFKTDAIAVGEVPTRAERYVGQMKLYAASMSPIFKKPVTRAWLVFLHCRTIHSCPVSE